MTTTSKTNAPQTAAVLALGEHGATANGRYVEAKELGGVSGATLAALVSKGLVKTATGLNRANGWDVAAYRLTWAGMTVLSTARRNVQNAAN